MQKSGNIGIVYPCLATDLRSFIVHKYVVSVLSHCVLPCHCVCLYRKRYLNIWMVFLFVAAWHDLDLRLLHWGLIMPAALVPEMVSRID
jgi:hypothetical protein